MIYVYYSIVYSIQYTLFKPTRIKTISHHHLLNPLHTSAERVRAGDTFTAGCVQRRWSQGRSAVTAGFNVYGSLNS